MAKKSEKRKNHDRFRKLQEAGWDEAVPKYLVPYIRDYRIYPDALFVSFKQVRPGAPDYLNIHRQPEGFSCLSYGYRADFDSVEELQSFLLAVPAD